MKFLCERCKTKYSIADEKVRRKILKIRCKNCSNIITVRDPEAKSEENRAASKPPATAARKLPLESALETAFSDSMEGEATGLATHLPEFRPEAMAADDEWYVAIAGNQQGPLPFANLAMLVERGTAREDSFVWRDGFEDWMRADGVPELRPFFKKRTGSQPPASKALPKREVPRPTDGKLAARTGTPAPMTAAKSGPISVASRSEAIKPTPAPKFDTGEDDIPDMSDSLENDESEEAAPLGESVKDAVSGLFSAADSGRVPQSDIPEPKSPRDPDSGLHLDIGEPSRIVKLDAILAAGAKGKAAANATGSVFKLPGLEDDAASEAQKVASQTNLPAAPRSPSGGYSPILAPLPPAHHDHALWKIMAIGGGLASLVLVVVVVLLLGRGGGTKTVIIEKEKSPEDVGAEFAEQIAREEASKKFANVTPTRGQDFIPAKGSGGPPPRRSTMPPPPHKVGSDGKGRDDRLAKLYGEKGPGSETPVASRPAEDALEPFKRGAKLCLDRALKKDPSLAGAKIEVKIAVSASGGVSNVSIPGAYKDAFVGQCLSGVIKHLPWPANGRPYDIDMPLLLSGG